jgi:hypothetical protein
MTLAWIAQLSSLAVVAMATRIVVRARAAAKESVRQGAQRLQRIVDGLEESQTKLAEAQAMAHVGNWEFDCRVITWSGP